MARQNEGLAKGLILGFLAGSVIGSVTALLLAPKSGADLRKEIKKKADELKEAAKVQIEQAKAKGEDIVMRGKKNLMNL
jgi:hypothetical protein